MDTRHAAVENAAVFHTTRKWFSAVHRPSTLVAAVLTALAITALGVWQLRVGGLRLGGWDHLFLSGCLTTIAGLWLARGQAERFAATFDRLANRRALGGRRGDDMTGYRDGLLARGERWALRGGIVAGAVLGALWIYAFAQADVDQGTFEAIVGPIVGALGGYLVGRALGRMLAYSLLGRYLQKRGVAFRADPEHIDGAAGLKPLGDYYLYQALLLAVPALFLLFWSLMFALPYWSERYGAWRESYLGLLAAAILLEIAAFVAPMWQAHAEMSKTKRTELVKADKTLAREIANLRAQLETALSAEDRAAANALLERKCAHYTAIEEMPTWPLDRAVRRRVTLGNAGLVSDWSPRQRRSAGGREPNPTSKGGVR